MSCELDLIRGVVDVGRGERGREGRLAVTNCNVHDMTKLCHIKCFSKRLIIST